MNIKEAGIATILTGSLLTAPTSADFQKNIDIKSSDASNNSTETAVKDEAKVPLAIMKNLLNLEETTSLRSFYEETLKNPQGHIVISDSEVVDQNNLPITTNFKIYSIDKETEERSPLYSINILKDNRINRVSMEMIITRRGDLFKGDEDNLAGFGELSLSKLAYLADHCYNSPEDMNKIAWSERVNVKDKSHFLEKMYIDNNLNIYIMRVTDKNQIMFSAPYPIPDNHSRRRIKLPEPPLA